MKIEEKLKELIVERYGSMVEFSKSIGIPNPTLASILSRGIHKANVTNVIKICKALGISTDELAKDKIVPVKTASDLIMREMRDVLNYYKMKFQAYDGFTVDGVPMDEADAEMFIDSMEFALELIKRKKQREIGDETVTDIQQEQQQ